MAGRNNESAKRGVTFTELLLLAFIVLKLCGVINWPWIWVLCPIWITIIIWLMVILIGVLIGAVKGIVKKRRTD